MRPDYLNSPIMSGPLADINRLRQTADALIGNNTKAVKLAQEMADPYGSLAQATDSFGSIAKANELLRQHSETPGVKGMLGGRARIYEPGAGLYPQTDFLPNPDKPRRETFDLNPPVEPRRSSIPLPSFEPLVPQVEPGSVGRRLAALISDGKAEQVKREAARVKLQTEMAEALVAMRAAIVEGNAREAESLERATAAERREAETQKRSERRERYMLMMTAASMIFGAVSTAALIFGS